VEPVCAVLEFPASTYYAAKEREHQPSRRKLRDEWLKKHIMRVWNDRRKGRRLYGARKVWLQLRREGIVVARCTVERLMRELGIEGAAARRKKPRTTVPAPAGQQPADLVRRDFTAPAPNRRWVADITYTDTACGFAYTAFITDLFSRKIVGWQVADHLRADLALDTRWRWRSSHAEARPAQILSIIPTGACSTPRSGTRSDWRISGRSARSAAREIPDNAAAEAVNSLYKKELINREGLWQDVGEVTVATAEWVHWYNNDRLHSSCGNIPPEEYEKDWLMRQAHTIIIPEAEAS
jgi:putative transposase